MNLIVAVDSKFGIGKNNGLLFHLPADLKFFKETTLNKTIIMGERTFYSLPNSAPLKNRQNVVLTNNDNFNRNDVVVCRSMQEVLDFCKNKDDVFIIGGGMVYRQFLPYCKTAYITKIFADGKADIFFENVDMLPNWKLKEKSPTFKEGDIEFCFCVYENLNPLNN